MDAYISGGNRNRARLIENEWDDTQKPALERIERATMDFLHALDMARTDLMLAKDIKAVDALACDTAAGTITLLNQLHTTQKRELDDCGTEPDTLTLDLSCLKEEHATWEARWDARKAVA